MKQEQELTISFKSKLAVNSPQERIFLWMQTSGNSYIALCWRLSAAKYLCLYGYLSWEFFHSALINWSPTLAYIHGLQNLYYLEMCIRKSTVFSTTVLASTRPDVPVSGNNF
jgi:hypothetical protein